MALRDRLSNAAATAIPAIPAILSTQKPEAGSRIATIATIAGSEPRFWRFVVAYPDGSGFDATTSPATTPAAARRLWAGADVRPISEDPTERATGAQADEIRDLVEQVIGVQHADYSAAVAIALADPVAALESFRADARMRA